MVNVDKIIAWEDGSISRKDELKLFQELVNTGQAWRLQGMYGRHAKRLLDAGLIKPKKTTTKTKKYWK